MKALGGQVDKCLVSYNAVAIDANARLAQDFDRMQPEPSSVDAPSNTPLIRLMHREAEARQFDYLMRREVEARQLDYMLQPPDGRSLTSTSGN